MFNKRDNSGLRISERRCLVGHYTRAVSARSVDCMSTSCSIVVLINLLVSMTSTTINSSL